MLIVALCLFGFAWLFHDCVGCWLGCMGGLGEFVVWCDVLQMR